MFLFKNDLRCHWAVGGIGFFMIFGLMDQVRADAPVSASTNAAPPIAPSTSTPTATPPAAKSDNQALGGLSIDDLQCDCWPRGLRQGRLQILTTALKADNSPEVIFGYYHDLLRPEAAKAWKKTSSRPI